MMAFRTIATIGAACALAAGGGVAQAQTALGNSMGSDSSASATSTTASKASGAHHTPVARAARRQAGSESHKARSSTMASGTATGSGDMTPSGNANPTNQH